MSKNASDEVRDQIHAAVRQARWTCYTTDELHQLPLTFRQQLATAMHGVFEKHMAPGHRPIQATCRAQCTLPIQFDYRVTTAKMGSYKYLDKYSAVALMNSTATHMLFIVGEKPKSIIPAVSTSRNVPKGPFLVFKSNIQYKCVLVDTKQNRMSPCQICWPKPTFGLVAENSVRSIDNNSNVVTVTNHGAVEQQQQQQQQQQRKVFPQVSTFQAPKVVAQASFAPTFQAPAFFTQAPTLSFQNGFSQPATTFPSYEHNKMEQERRFLNDEDDNTFGQEWLSGSIEDDDVMSSSSTSTGNVTDVPPMHQSSNVSNVSMDISPFVGQDLAPQAAFRLASFGKPEPQCRISSLDMGGVNGMDVEWADEDMGVADQQMMGFGDFSSNGLDDELLDSFMTGQDDDMCMMDY